MDVERRVSPRRRRFLRWGLGAAILAAVIAPAVPRLLFGPQIGGTHPERKLLIQTVAATGRVRPPARVEIASLLLGSVAEDRCREGAKVETGELLYHLSDAAERAQLAQAEAHAARARALVEELAGTGRRTDLEAVRRAEIALADARDRADRLERLRDAVDEARLEEARRARDLAASHLETARVAALGSAEKGTRYKLLRADLAQAEASVAQARDRLDDTRIVAPAKGVIAVCNARVGSVVSPGQAMLVLVASGPTEIVIEPDEKNVGLLALGQQAKVSADAFPDQVFTASVATIVPAVDPQRGTIEVRLVAAEPPPFLIPDLTVSVEIEVSRRPDALVIPREALRESNVGRSYVMVWSDGRAHRRDVRLGSRGEGSVEVVEGLSTEDWVLLPGPLVLGEGARVRVKPVKG